MKSTKKPTKKVVKVKKAPYKGGLYFPGDRRKAKFVPATIRAEQW
jgi:hypothetical protein